MALCLTRRRVISIAAAAAGLGLVPPAGAAVTGTALVTWHGEAMGALATLQLHHADRAAAERLIARAVAEVRRLERIFSLYRDDSSLVALNQRGVLLAPPEDLVILLGECRSIAKLTRGAFDPTVQALWSLYHEHFSTPGHDPAGPSAAAREAALGKVGFQDVTFDRDRIVLGRRGMTLTLNGIAQGYATDRIVALLRAEGIAHSLVDMGETRALDDRPDGRPWRIGIADPDAPERAAEHLQIIDKAVATSSASGFRFDPEGRFNHLFDPKGGRSASLYRSVTVVAPTATVADGLSTAFSLMEPDAIARALLALPDVEVRLMLNSGERRWLSAPPL